ncbi:hypothetical protein BDR22DRAFT_331420 [Usnea florida]
MRPNYTSAPHHFRPKVIQCIQAYREDGDEWTFDHCAILHSQRTEVFKAQSQLEFIVPSDMDAEQLDYPLIPIPKEDPWPPFTDHLTLAPHPLPNDTFLKKPSLIKWGLETGPKPREVLLHVYVRDTALL